MLVGVRRSPGSARSSSRARRGRALGNDGSLRPRVRARAQRRRDGATASGRFRFQQSKRRRARPGGLFPTCGVATRTLSSRAQCPPGRPVRPPGSRARRTNSISASMATAPRQSILRGRRSVPASRRVSSAASPPGAGRPRAAVAREHVPCTRVIGYRWRCGRFWRGCATCRPFRRGHRGRGAADPARLRCFQT